MTVRDRDLMGTSHPFQDDILLIRSQVSVLELLEQVRCPAGRYYIDSDELETSDCTAIKQWSDGLPTFLWQSCCLQQRAVRESCFRPDPFDPSFDNLKLRCYNGMQLEASLVRAGSTPASASRSCHLA